VALSALALVRLIRTLHEKSFQNLWAATGAPVAVALIPYGSISHKILCATADNVKQTHRKICFQVNYISLAPHFIHAEKYREAVRASFRRFGQDGRNFSRTLNICGAMVEFSTLFHANLLEECELFNTFSSSVENFLPSVKLPGSF
jgi:hypothetical protein